MPRLSVHMPAFNAEATVRSAVNSVLGDLPQDAELVVLDDGSSDSTRAVVESLSDPRVRVLQGTHEGVGRASQALLDQTDSEFVARMDSDDIWIRGRARRQLHSLERGVDAVFTTVVLWGPEMIPRPNVPVRVDQQAFPFHLLLGNPVAHSTMMARRSAVEKAGGYRPFRTTEDYDLFLRLAGMGANMHRLALPGLAYRVHPQQTTASSEWRRASWDNPEIAASYSQLAQHVLGYSAQRITNLAIDDARPAEDRRAAYREFRTRFESAIRHLPRGSRWALRRKLAERTSWLESQLSSQVERS